MAALAEEGAQPGSAENPLENVESQKNRIIDVEFISVYSTAVTHHDGRNVRVSFDIANQGAYVQPGLTYAFQVIHMTGAETGDIVDTFLAPEKLTLRANEWAAGKSFSFTFPSYLAGGDYLFRVLVGGPTGLTLGRGQTEIVSIPDAQADRIGLRDCAVQIGSEGATKSYALDQGIDIGTHEDLLLVCQAINATGKVMKVAPVFHTYRRAVLSNAGADTFPIADQSITLENVSSQQVILRLPVAKLPQAYDAVAFLTDESGNRVSNSIAAHYVVRGASATFQNFLLDKDTYAAGDTALVNYV